MRTFVIWVYTSDKRRNYWKVRFINIIELKYEVEISSRVLTAIIRITSIVQRFIKLWYVEKKRRKVRSSEISVKFDRFIKNINIVIEKSKFQRGGGGCK